MIDMGTGDRRSTYYFFRAIKLLDYIIIKWQQNK